MTVKYARPPIFECVIEVKLDAAVDDAMLDRLRKAAAARYPLSEDEVEFEFRIQAGGQQAVAGKAVGGRFRSADAADILLIRRDALIIARAAPYLGWTAFKDRALDELRRWTKVIGERKRYARLGVRYQNRIDVPLTPEQRFDPGPYVTVLPQRPPILQGAATAFNVHIGGCPVGDYMVSLTVGIMPSPLINHAGLLVDIDAFAEGIDSYSELLGKIEGVRDVKNAVFESVITDAARATFQ